MAYTRTPLDLERFYRDHQRLVRWIVRTSGVPSAAEDDLVQEVFIAAYRRQDAIPPDLDVRCWLVGVSKNVCFNHRRAMQRRRLRDRLWWSTRSPRSTCVESSVAHKQDLERVFERLRLLDHGQREVFVMVELAEMTTREVATSLGLNPNTVSSRLRLARQKIRALPSSVVQAVRDDDAPTSPRTRAIWLCIAARVSPRVAVSIAPLVAKVVATGTLAAAIGVTAGVALHRSPSPAPSEVVAVGQVVASLSSMVEGSRPIASPELAGVVGSKPSEDDERALRRVPSLRARATEVRDREASVQSMTRDVARGGRRDAARTTRAGTLSEESALLLRAVEALDRGDVATSRVALDEHARKFPHGALWRERERFVAKHTALITSR